MDGDGMKAGIGFGAVVAAVVGGAWGLYLLVVTFLENLVASHAASIKAEADAAITYAAVRQMNMVTRAAEVTIAQGQALPWVLVGVIVLLIVLLLAVIALLLLLLRRLQQAQGV
jgi:hypothetical protein